MSNKPFKKLRGRRVIIENFAEEAKEQKGPKIELLPETKQAIEDQKLKKKMEDGASTQRFKVIQVGDEIDDIQEGDEIHIENPMGVLAPERAETIIEKGKIIGFIIPDRVISGVY